MKTRRTEMWSILLLAGLPALALAFAAACSPGAGGEPTPSALPVSAGGTSGAPWYETPARPGRAPAHSYRADQIERGRRLVAFGMCSDCHTPMRPDPATGAVVPDTARFLSGHPEGAPLPAGTLGPEDAALIGPTFTSFRLPFGTVYAMNLTPDVETGSGSWTEEMFVNIFRKGKHLGGDGRPVLPPMPWSFVATLSDDDLVAIFAYLRSLQPVRNYVPSPEVPEAVMWQIDAANQRALGHGE